jgi:hypothetical protein
MRRRTPSHAVRPGAEPADDNGGCGPRERPRIRSANPTTLTPAQLENGDRGGWPPFSKHRCLGRGGCHENFGARPTRVDRAESHGFRVIGLPRRMNVGLRRRPMPRWNL